MDELRDFFFFVFVVFVLNIKSSFFRFIYECVVKDVTSGNKGQEIARKVREAMDGTDDGSIINATGNENEGDETMEIDEGMKDAAAIHLNNIPVMMTIVTIVIMVCSALFFVATA